VFMCDFAILDSAGCMYVCMYVHVCVCVWCVCVVCVVCGCCGVFCIALFVSFFLTLACDSFGEEKN